MMTNPGSKITAWRVSERLKRKSAPKQAFHGVKRSFLSAISGAHLWPSFRRKFCPYAVYFTRGALEDWRWRQDDRHANLIGATVLTQGRGIGWDALVRAEFKPGRIIATKFYSFDDSREKISAESRDRLGGTLDFRQAALEYSGFLASGPVDLWRALLTRIAGQADEDGVIVRAIFIWLFKPE